ncbi:hypothetical protein FRB99_002768 [Tulasnella sp. 403]|nr:hypothetical protein FRB99_002768 [Tulasnella sp. 403]
MKIPLALIFLCHVFVATPASLLQGRAVDRTGPVLVRTQETQLTTNAQRLAAGLTPLPPKRLFKSRTGALKPRQSLSPTIIGKIVIRNVGSDAVELSPSSTFEVLKTTNILADATTGPTVGVLTQNDPTTADVKSNSPNYVYIYFGPPPPSGTAREAIWSYVPSTLPGQPGQLTATWVNGDNSEANTIMYARPSTPGGSSGLYILSDPNSDGVAAIFRNRPDVSEVVEVYIQFVIDGP